MQPCELSNSPSARSQALQHHTMIQFAGHKHDEEGGEISNMHKLVPTTYLPRVPKHNSSIKAARAAFMDNIGFSAPSPEHQIAFAHSFTLELIDIAPHLVRLARLDFADIILSFLNILESYSHRSMRVKASPRWRRCCHRLGGEQTRSGARSARSWTHLQSYH